MGAAHATWRLWSRVRTLACLLMSHAPDGRMRCTPGGKLSGSPRASLANWFSRRSMYKEYVTQAVEPATNIITLRPVRYCRSILLSPQRARARQLDGRRDRPWISQAS
eukprot:2161266-Prymnesium_polylepis.1